ncbi:MAG: hypothetical protein L0Z55_04755 [Planctomycetes bacterium]|nr:hypothetical protein [Planctomycetota bacterium]
MHTRSIGLALAGSAVVAWSVLAGSFDEVPRFKHEAAGAAFDEAKKLFDARDFKEAEKRFKECQDSTDADGKKILKPWLNACKGGVKLAGVTKAIASKEWKAAESELKKLSAAFGDTPLRPQLAELSKQVDGELYTPLANFEEDAPAPEKAVQGRGEDAKYNTDAAFVHSGARSLKWSAEVELMGMRPIAFLPLARMEEIRLADHRALHLAIYSPDDAVGKFTVFFDVGNLEQVLRSQEILKARGFFYHITINRPGWTEIRVDLDKELSTYSNATRDEIQGINLLMIPPSKPKTIFIDDVRLEKPPGKK